MDGVVKLLYWKTFLLMCITAWIFTLADATMIVLNIFNVIHISTGIVVVLILLLLVLMMTSFLCFVMFNTEMKERRNMNEH